MYIISSINYWLLLIDLNINKYAYLNIFTILMLVITQFATIVNNK